MSRLVPSHLELAEALVAEREARGFYLTTSVVSRSQRVREVARELPTREAVISVLAALQAEPSREELLAELEQAVLAVDPDAAAPPRWRLRWFTATPTPTRIRCRCVAECRATLPDLDTYREHVARNTARRAARADQELHR